MTPPVRSHFGWVIILEDKRMSYPLILVWVRLRHFQMSQVTITSGKINTPYDFLSHNYALKSLHTNDFHWLITEATYVEEYYSNFDIETSWVYFVLIILSMSFNTIKQNFSSFPNSGCKAKLPEHPDALPGLSEEAHSDQGPAGAVLRLQQSFWPTGSFPSFLSWDWALTFRETSSTGNQSLLIFWRELFFWIKISSLRILFPTQVKCFQREISCLC